MTYFLIFILGAACGTLCFALVSYDKTTKLEHKVKRLSKENETLKLLLDSERR